jgi:hypothetical protein
VTRWPSTIAKLSQSAAFSCCLLAKRERKDLNTGIKEFDLKGHVFDRPLLLYAHVEHGTQYPAVLLETGMNDPRVEPWEMAKMTARLQAATSSRKPILLRVEFTGGHGGMGGTQKQHHEALADEWSFLFWQLGVREFQPYHR